MKEEANGFRCGELLKIPSMQDAIILAGKNGLHRMISKVNVMEVPDVIQWVRHGEFLMTTGYPFRENPDDIAQLIPQLVEKGVAALGIKTRRFIETVPDTVIALADQYGFPLIELPPSISFSDLVRDVMERVLIGETGRLVELQDRLQVLAQLLLDGKSIELFLEKLELLLHNPVLLVDSFNQLILSSNTRSMFEEHQHQVSWNQLHQSMNSGILHIAGRDVKTYTSVIKRHQNTSSILTLLEWNKEITAVDAITIDRVGVFAGLELMNEQVRRAVETKYFDQFLQDWLTGRIPALTDLFLRAETCGVKVTPSVSYSVAIAYGFREAGAASALQKRVTELRSEALPFAEPLQFTVIESQLVILIPRPHGNIGNLSTEKDYTQILAFIKQTLREPSLTLCIGKEVNTPEEVHTSYTEAKRIRHIAGVCSMHDPILTNDRLGIYLLLYLLIGKPEYEAFMGRFLYPLEAYDKQHNTFLIDTLTAYFKAGGNVRAAANALFTHYNTVTYRLKQISSLLNLDLDDPDMQLQMQLAVKLHQIRDN